MDQANDSNVVCKVSIVDEEGRILLDTLINPEQEITRSLCDLHGIQKEWLKDAPTLTEVRAYTIEMFGQCIFVGHSVQHDLRCFGMTAVRFIDTSYFEDKGRPEDIAFKHVNAKRLKDLCTIYLNAQI